MFRKKVEPAVPGRAFIVPAGTHSRQSHGRIDYSPDFLVSADIHMKAISAIDGFPVDQRVIALFWPIPNWMFQLFHDAGSNAPGAEHMPPSVTVDVGISLATRLPIAIDVDRANVELQPYRDVAVAAWKMIYAPLADVRQLMQAPSKVRKGLKDINSTWGDVVNGMSTPKAGQPARQSVRDADIPAIQRQANILSFHFEKYPDQWQTARNSALQALPLQAQQVRSGVLHPVDFEVAVMRSQVSKTISDEEAAWFRQQAGLA